MICEKTGATIYLEEYGCTVRGDTFRLGADLLVRVNNRSITREPVPIHHYRIRETVAWWDKFADQGTIVATDFIYFGYEGETQ